MTPQLFLPLLTYPDANAEAIVANAVAVTAQMHGGLHAVAFNAEIPGVSSALSRKLLNVPAMIREAESSSSQRGDLLLRKLAELAGSAEIAVTTERKAGAITLLGTLAAEQARYFDLSLVGWEAANSTSKATARAIVFGSGRPTMVLPELSQVKTFKHIAIAWDGGRAAARAVADALPFLQQASEIRVLTVTGEKPLEEQEAGERLAQGLRRRGLATAQASFIIAEDCPIATTIQRHAVDAQADLLVMGAYGHSRVRDFVLGGATKGVLENLLLPVLLSH